MKVDRVIKVIGKGLIAGLIFILLWFGMVFVVAKGDHVGMTEFDQWSWAFRLLPITGISICSILLIQGDHSYFTLSLLISFVIWKIAIWMYSYHLFPWFYPKSIRFWDSRGVYFYHTLIAILWIGQTWVCSALIIFALNHFRSNK